MEERTGDPLLIRCEDCDECSLVCDKNAIARVTGVLLVDVSVCLTCKLGVTNGLPGCIQKCPKSGRKTILEPVPIEDKRSKAAVVMPLLTV